MFRFIPKREGLKKIMLAKAILKGWVIKKDKKVFGNGYFQILLNIKTHNRNQFGKNDSYHYVYAAYDLSEYADENVFVGDLLEIEGNIHNKKAEYGQMQGKFIYQIHATCIKKLEKDIIFECDEYE